MTSRCCPADQVPLTSEMAACDEDPRCMSPRVTSMSSRVNELAEEKTAPGLDVLESPCRSLPQGDDDTEADCTARSFAFWAMFPVFLLVELCAKYYAWRYRAQVVLVNVDMLNLRIAWTYTENTRSALGFLQGVPTQVRQGIYCLMALLTLAAAVWACLPGQCRVTRLGIACYVVGACGNLVDRALISCVVDYLMVRLYHDSWCIFFNMSDLVINIGFGLLIYKVWNTA